MFYEHDNAVVRILRMPLIGPVFLRLVGLRKLRSIAANALAGTPRRSEYEHLFGQQLARPGFLHAFLSFARSDALGDYRPLLSAVGEESRRVLLIWGAADAVVPAQDMADVRSSIVGILYSELEGGDHTVVFSAPIELWTSCFRSWVLREVGAVRRLPDWQREVDARCGTRLRHLLRAGEGVEQNKERVQ